MRLNSARRYPEQDPKVSVHSRDLACQRILEVERLPQNKPQLFSTLVTLVRETVRRGLALAFLHPARPYLTAPRWKTTSRLLPKLTVLKLKGR
jgi:hypothetical protein